MLLDDAQERRFLALIEFLQGVALQQRRVRLDERLPLHLALLELLLPVLRLHGLLQQPSRLRGALSQPALLVLS